MHPVSQREHRAGLSLIELLCVAAIITILAAMILGPAGRALQKARADQWADQADPQVSQILQKLKERFQGKRSFARVTLADLESQGVLNGGQVRILKDRRVTFSPFSGSDPEDTVVIGVELAKGFWTDRGLLTVTKHQITAPPE